DVAGDFTVNELDGGSWSLGDRWSGCGSYLFVSFVASNNPALTDALWGSSVEPLVATSVNHHFFFLSWETTPAERQARVRTIRDRVEAALTSANLSEEQLILQRARFHYVTDAPREVSGSVGAWFQDYLTYFNNPASVVDLGERGPAPPPFPIAVGIDREQKWDSVGSLSEAVGRPWDLRMVSYLPAFYDHKAQLRDRLESEVGVETHVLLDAAVTDRIFVRSATLAASLDAFDTLEVDVAVNCRERNVFACSEWDRIARVQVCLDGANCETRRELVRWITPYWRRGSRRWIMDASALMGLVAPGGLQYFRIEMGPGWERKTQRDVRVALRFSNQSVGLRATTATRAFTGGNLDFDYNRRDPFRFTPPSGAQKVELVVILSGHGQDANTNCAEWCDHRHQFVVNGTAVPEIRHTGTIGSLGGCGPAAARGASPGQYGNWAPERAYWCPGVPVDHIRIDITNLVTLGASNELTYSANFEGRAFLGGGNASLSAYVTYAE
ncbi:MAG: peptide-N-glycosidase F-related protein, partial [Myxococcota bacterium]